MNIKLFSSQIVRRLSDVRFSFILLIIAAFIVTSFLYISCEKKAKEEVKPFKVLVFSKTSGFRHDIIPTGKAAIQELGNQNHFEVDTTENALAFTDENLKQYKAVIFLNTTQDVLDDEQQAVFERYIRNGNGFMGIHAASDTEYEWSFYAGLIGGAHFKSHPKIQKAVVVVEDRNHIATEMLPERWECLDEWYNFRNNPREKVRVLASLDETSYDPGDGKMGDHPIIWYQNYEGGRAFYTGLGHTEETFADPLYLQHLLGCIKWTAGVDR